MTRRPAPRRRPPMCRSRRLPCGDAELRLTRPRSLGGDGFGDGGSARAHGLDASVGRLLAEADHAFGHLDLGEATVFVGEDLGACLCQEAIERAVGAARGRELTLLELQELESL